MHKRRPPNNDPKKEKLYQAIDAALLALGKRQATLEAAANATEQITEGRIADLSQKIWQSLGRTHETDLAVTLPYHAIANLLLGIKNLEIENAALKISEANRDELLDTLSRAYDAFDDKGIMGHEKQCAAAIKVLGFKRSKQDGASWLDEYGDLVKGGNYNPTTKEWSRAHTPQEALEILTEEHRKDGSVEAMYQSLKRAKKELNARLAAEGKSPFSAQLPPSPSNKKSKR